jgi:hypothetical protein
MCAKIEPSLSGCLLSGFNCCLPNQRTIMVRCRLGPHYNSASADVAHLFRLKPLYFAPLAHREP